MKIKDIHNNYFMLARKISLGSINVECEVKECECMFLIGSSVNTRIVYGILRYTVRFMGCTINLIYIPRTKKFHGVIVDAKRLATRLNISEAELLIKACNT